MWEPERSCREGAAPGYGQGDPDAALYPEMLGRRRTQAGVIIRTDSQRNVSRGNRVGWAIFRGRAPRRFLIFCHPSGHPKGTQQWQTSILTRRVPAAHSGVTIPAEGCSRPPQLAGEVGRGEPVKREDPRRSDPGPMSRLLWWIALPGSGPQNRTKSKLLWNSCSGWKAGDDDPCGGITAHNFSLCVC